MYVRMCKSLSQSLFQKRLYTQGCLQMIILSMLLTYILLHTRFSCILATFTHLNTTLVAIFSLDKVSHRYTSVLNFDGVDCKLQLHHSMSIKISPSQQCLCLFLFALHALCVMAYIPFQIVIFKNKCIELSWTKYLVCNF
jgi:hypothetical protein